MKNKNNKKNIIIVSIISIIIILLFLPVLMETIKMKNQFKMIHNDIEETLKIKIEEQDSDYSEYYDIKSLKYEVTKIYKTNTFNEYGYEITFSVDSDYNFSPYGKKTEYSLIIFSLDDLLDKLVDNYYDKDIKIEHYKYTLKINGEEVYHKYDGSNFSIYDEFINEQYQEYKIKIEENHIVWEYTNEKLKLKRTTTYMNIMLTIIFGTSISLTGMVLISYLASYYKKNVSVTTKVTIECIGDIAKYLILFIIIGIFTGGVGFVAIPLLWLLNNRK